MHRFKLKRWLTIGMSAAFAIGLSGCSEDGGSTTSATAANTGVLFDGPVSGVNYSSPSHSGKTDADGKFDYASGENVDFEFGTVKLGGARGKGVITPLDLMNADYDNDLVQMIASFLQSLDKDGQHGNGIQLNDDIAKLLAAGLSSGDYSSLLDFKALASLTEEQLTEVKAKLETLLLAVVKEANEQEIDLRYVSLDQAANNLAAELDEKVVFRKNISKTPEAPSAKSKFNIMPTYVPATKASGDAIEADAEGNCATGQKLVDKGDTCWTHPLVAAYTDVDFRRPAGAADAFLAISRDDGLSWKRFNLSRTGDKEVEVTGLPTVALGESRKPIVQVKGNKILVAWTDKYCKGGQARYSVLADTDVNGDGVIDNKDKLYPDYYGVAGSQGVIDYTTVVPTVAPERMPNPAIVAYSCMWTARTTINSADGAIRVYKSERMTSGTRDAYQIFVGGASNAGFGIVWQEDPEGLRPGSGDGPGHGFSGATTNHKTDVWFSHIKWSDFDAYVEEEVTPDLEDDGSLVDEPADPALIGDATKENARVRAVNHMSMPVRITDNNMCNLDNIATKGHEYCRLSEPDEITGEQTLVTWDGWDFVDFEGNSSPTTPPKEVMQNCWDMKEVPSANGTQTVCITKAGSVLDGDTGASRPNLMMQPFTKPDGSVSAYAVIGYEETKGVGGGPEIDPEDIGKDVFYQSFEFIKPDLVASGDRVNLPELTRNEDGTAGDPIIIENPDGTVGYATENARRVRFIIQGKKPALAIKDGVVKGAGVPLLVIYKQGPLGKGRPSDIMLRRLSVLKPDGSVKGGNPYAYSNFLCDNTIPATEHTYVVDGVQYTSELPATCNAKGPNGVQNMSSVTPEITLPPQSGEDEVTALDGTKTVYDKLMTWNVTEADLLKESWQTPMTESRAHRGQVRGDYVAFGYVQTPNWAAARNGKDKYNYYIRRSFDAGATWTTNPEGSGVTNSCYWERTTLATEPTIKCNDFAAGAFERPRDLSLLKNAKESVIEPRVVAVPGTINACDGAMCVGLTTPNEDKQNKNVFITSYGLADNTDPTGAEPTDMFYAKTDNFGETYTTVEHNVWLDSNSQPLQVFDWMAKRSNVEEGEAQLRLTPDGSKAYTSYLAESNSDYDGPDHFKGSDIWFRKFDGDDFYPVEPTTEETTSSGDTSDDAD